MKTTLWKDTRGYAVVEATILFPIIIMIFAGIVLLAMYLPTRAGLQRATQYAATAIATERSDTWLKYDVDGMKYCWEANKDRLGNVYSSLVCAIISNGYDDDESDTKRIVVKAEENNPFKAPGELTVEYGVVNYIIYKEIIVTATRTVPMPVDLSFVKFPKEIPVTVTSTAVVVNGDEFVRNMDLAADITQVAIEATGTQEIFEKAGALFGKINELLGI